MDPHRRHQRGKRGYRCVPCMGLVAGILCTSSRVPYLFGALRGAECMQSVHRSSLWHVGYLWHVGCVYPSIRCSEGPLSGPASTEVLCLPSFGAMAADDDDGMWFDETPVLTRVAPPQLRSHYPLDATNRLFDLVGERQGVEMATDVTNLATFSDEMGVEFRCVCVQTY